jgi:transitional endoplasmic reticulum ATPase
MIPRTTIAARFAGYICNVMAATAPDSIMGRKLAVWLHGNGVTVGIDYRAATGSRGAASRPLSAKAWRQLMAAAAETAGGCALPADALAVNLDSFAQTVGLDRLDTAILRFVLDTDLDRRFDLLCASLVATREIEGLGLIGLAVGDQPDEIAHRLRRGPLGALNLVRRAGDNPERFNFHVPYPIRRALLPPSEGLADIERHLIGVPMRPQLDIDDFAHLARERDFVLRLLRGAIERQRKGVNILLYGPPGTGKSEFCKVAARALGCVLFAVGEADEDGDELDRIGRLDALRGRLENR